MSDSPFEKSHDMARILAVSDKFLLAKHEIDRFLQVMAATSLGRLQAKATFYTTQTIENWTSAHPGVVTYDSHHNRILVECRGILAGEHVYPNLPEKFNRVIVEALPDLIKAIADEAEKIAKREGFS
jgi:hypothetical protein